MGKVICPSMIEKMVKEFKTHRCALDFHGQYFPTVKKEVGSADEEHDSETKRCTE